MNSSLKYLSFGSPNASRMNAPLAESTAIGSPMTQQHDSFRGNQKKKASSPLSNASKQRSVQIEPHVLTNAQSRGIVKRLVTYYDESQNDGDKSRYVYNRVGDLPIVHLKKNEIKRSIVRSSSVRIAPPSKNVLNRDVRAAILRSNSFQMGANVPKLLPTKMRAKDDSHQIITNHDPLPIDESLQTAKSVLDALEKNCRKRINNEELTMDRNKRVCAQEVVDSPSTREFVPIASQSAKRNREQLSPNQRNQSDSPNSQLRKKLRMRNNALSSSLSSSFFAMKPCNSNASPSLPFPFKPIATVSTVPQQLSRAPEEPAKQLEASAAPPAPTQIVKNGSADKPEPVVKRLYLFNRKLDAAPVNYRKVPEDDDGKKKVNFVKPREVPTETGDRDVIRHLENEKLSMMLSGLSDGFKSPTREFPKDSVDSAVTASISFTTVTTSSTASPISTPSSSALPLSSVAFTTSSLVSPVKTVEAPAVPTVAITPATTSATTAPSTVSEAPKPLLSLSFGNAAPAVSAATTTISSPMSPVSPTTTISSGRVSPLAIFTTPNATQPTSVPSIDPNKSMISFTPIAKPLPTVVASSVPSTTSAFASLAAVPSLTSQSTTSGFSFGSNKEAPKVASGFSFDSNASSIGFGGSSTLSVIPSAAASVPTLTTTSTPSFNFQTPSATSFSFGAKPVIATTTGSSLSTAISSTGTSTGNLARTNAFVQKPETTTASGIGFSFSNTSNVTAPTTTASSGFTFGSSQNSLSANPMPAVPVTTASSFNFGATSNPAFGQSAATPAPSGFPSFAPKTNAAQPSGSMFSFGQKTAAPASDTATPSFSFGGSVQPTPAAQSSVFNLGQANTIQPAMTTATSPPSIFGRLGEKQAEAKTAFSFGGSSQVQQPSMPSMFGNSNNAPPTTNASSFGSFGGSVFNQTASSGSNMFASNSTGDFGGGAKPAVGNMFSFGSTNSSVQPAPSQPSAPSGMFNFSNNAAPAPTPVAANVFGNSGSNVSASFTFKPSTGSVISNNAAPSVFGQSQNVPSATPPAYQFGNQQTSNNVSASFNFGGSASAASSQSSGFNFGGPQTAPAIGTGGSFNFQGQQPSLTPQPSSGGLFSIGSAGTQRRPMRQATRRMK